MTFVWRNKVKTGQIRLQMFPGSQGFSLHFLISSTEICIYKGFSHKVCHAASTPASDLEVPVPLNGLFKSALDYYQKLQGHRDDFF